MTCPKCGGYTMVVNSRVRKEEVYRRRECQTCRYRFSTMEIDMDVYNMRKGTAMPEVRQKVQRAMDKIQECFAEILDGLGTGG